jgi:hypothetical protein
VHGEQCPLAFFDHADLDGSAGGCVVDGVDEQIIDDLPQPVLVTDDDDRAIDVDAERSLG